MEISLEVRCITMILIKSINIYSPKYIGKKDILIGGKEILMIEDDININIKNMKVIDGRKKSALPGFIDGHVHITGGGGENSFKSRVPEIKTSTLIKGGITTVLGLLGTDSITRSVENLVSKAKALKEEGISAYVLTGSYEYPSPTITGSIKKDIVFIEEVIGTKIAISDHRDSNITVDEFSRIASDTRVAGLLSGKAGIIIVHLGHSKRNIDIIWDILENTDIPINNIRPTHVSKNKELLKECFKFAKQGGYIDVTCNSGNISNYNIIMQAKRAEVPLEKITFSSDGNGSWSKYDIEGRITKIGVSSASSMFEGFSDMIDNGMRIEDSLPFYTSNVARGLDIYPQKGSLSVGSDADILIIDEKFMIDTVIALGNIKLENKGIIFTDIFEE